MRTLTTPEGLVLRGWRRTDAAALLAAFSESVEMARQAGRAPVGDLADAREWIERWNEQGSTDRAYFFAVTDGEGGAVLGNVGVASVERTHDSGWVTYWTVEAARGRGVAAIGARRLAEFCFRQIGLHRLELGHRTNNPASCSVARRAGFAAEGIERDKLRYGEERHDVERHARLATDPCPAPLVNEG